MLAVVKPHKQGQLFHWLIVLGVFCTTYAVQAQEHGQDHADEIVPTLATDPEDGEALGSAIGQKHSKNRAPTYGKHTALFRQWCSALQRDGRRELILNLANANLERNPACQGCRDFYKNLAKGCKGEREKPIKKKTVKHSDKQPKAEDEEEATAEHAEEPSAKPEAVKVLLVKQREPTLESLTLLDQLIQLMAADHKNVPAHYEVIQNFLVQLRASTNKTPGELEYCGLLADIVIAPFESYARVLERTTKEKGESEESVQLTEQEKKEELNTLFDF